MRPVDGDIDRRLVILLDYLLPRGIIVISANYRLLIPPSGHDMIEDIHTLFAYLGSPSSELNIVLSEHKLSLDLDRIATFGISSGAYLARIAGVCNTVLPRPRAMLVVSGMGGDLLLDHWISRKEGEGRRPVSEETAQLVERMLSGEEARVWSDLSLFQGERSEETKARQGLFITLYNDGEILDHILSLPGISARLRALPHTSRLSAIPESKRHLLLPITPSTCPTMVVHGKTDTSVPFTEGQATYDDLGKMGVERELVAFEGRGHEISDPVRMGWGEGWEEEFEKVLMWLEGMLRR